MRHALTTRFVVITTVVVVAAVALFAVMSNTTGDFVSRADVILGLEADIDNGRSVYTAIADPACGDCHTLADADVVSDRASDLDVMQPSARVTVQSLVGGTIRAHDSRGYEHALSNQQIADLARYIEAVAGR